MPFAVRDAIIGILQGRLALSFSKTSVLIADCGKVS
jgi:hypothetical protein